MKDFDEFLSDLTKGICRVVFVKKDKDKTERIMYGTRNKDIIGKLYPDTNKKIETDEEKRERYEKDKKNGQIRLFDIQKLGWRSFDELRIISFDFISDRNDFVPPEEDSDMSATRLIFNEFIRITTDGNLIKIDKFLSTLFDKLTPKVDDLKINSVPALECIMLWEQYKNNEVTSEHVFKGVLKVLDSSCYPLYLINNNLFIE